MLIISLVFGGQKERVIYKRRKIEIRKRERKNGSETPVFELGWFPPDFLCPTTTCYGCAYKCHKRWNIMFALQKVLLLILPTRSLKSTLRTLHLSSVVNAWHCLNNILIVQRATTSMRPTLMSFSLGRYTEMWWCQLFQCGAFCDIPRWEERMYAS